MSGIDKLMAHLNTDCDAECSAITDKARKRAEEILDSAEAQGKQRTSEIIELAEKQAEDAMKLAASTAEMKKKQRILSAKVNLINSVLVDALKSLEEMTGEEYWNTVEYLVSNNAQPGNGKILVSSSDYPSMPADFESKVNNKIVGIGSLKTELSESLNKKGVILLYGDIEINLTFEALISANSDELKEIAGNILFK